MHSFPLRASLGGGLAVYAAGPFATLVLVSRSSRAALCLSPHEQDRLRMLVEAGRRCDEILDPDEDAPDQVRCIRDGARLTLVQDGVRVVACGAPALAALLEVLRAVALGVEAER